MAPIFLLHHNFDYFSCDHRFELQRRIVNVVAWLCCQIYFEFSCARFNLITNLFEDSYKAKSSWIHTMVKSFMTLRFPALILSFAFLGVLFEQWRRSIFFLNHQLREGSPMFCNFVACGMNQIHHAHSSVLFWCLLFHINYFRCVQSSDNIEAAFIYKTAYDEQFLRSNDACSIDMYHRQCVLFTVSCFVTISILSLSMTSRNDWF